MYECECGRKLENKAGYASHKQHCDGGYDGMCLNCGENPARKYSKGAYGRFCSPECGRSYISEDGKETRNKKISETLSGKNSSNPSLKNRVLKKCEQCGTEFETVPSRNRKFCSRKCYNTYVEPKKEKLVFEKKCKFTFSLNNYPEWFNLNLIKKYGWYKPKNRGNNLNGVSRDHMVSVTYGWKNEISPFLISHPANCKLLLHKKNNSKNKDCSITVSELKKRILCFKNLYGPVAELG